MRDYGDSAAIAASSFSVDEAVDERPCVVCGETIEIVGEWEFSPDEDGDRGDFEPVFEQADDIAYCEDAFGLAICGEGYAHRRCVCDTCKSEPALVDDRIDHRCVYCIAGDEAAKTKHFVDAARNSGTSATAALIEATLRVESERLAEIARYVQAAIDARKAVAA